MAPEHRYPIAPRHLETPGAPNYRLAVDDPPTRVSLDPSPPLKHGQKLVDGIPQERDTLTGLEKSFSDLFTKMDTYEKSGQDDADARRVLIHLTTGIKRQLTDSLGLTQTHPSSSV
ncbi:hypothetical protein EHS25_007598 [Saitozyma podzolica]|uniref:Uncharacterized protein n=1 Tax=Saitozyma podzolica TaxID=1890683 RepID=A0A427YQ53_9TREE|nr:hypothetical protein EHS25_007598 [Saitozyma podzolica]